MALDSPTSTHDRGNTAATATSTDFITYSHHHHQQHYVDETTEAEPGGGSDVGDGGGGNGVSQSHYLSHLHHHSASHDDFIYSPADYSRIQQHAVRDIWAQASAASTNQETHHHHHHHHNHQDSSPSCDNAAYNNLRSKFLIKNLF